MNSKLNKKPSIEASPLSTQRDEQKLITLLFDFGGTLDTAGCHWGKFLWYAYKRNGIPVTTCCIQRTTKVKEER